MAVKHIRIGSMKDIHSYDDGDYNSAIETDAPMKAADPIDPQDVVTKNSLSSEVLESYEPPTFRVNKNGVNQMLGAGVWVKITWAVADFDTEGDFDFVNDRYTPSEAGKYLVCATLRAVGVAAVFGVALYKNGVLFQRLEIIDPMGISTATGTTILELNGAGDFVEVYGFRQLAGNISGNETSFSGVFLRR